MTSADRTPLRGRYLVRNPLWNAWLSASDFALRITHPSRNGARAAVPRRVLVAVGGHVGDAVIATGALAELARRLPGVEIGVLCSSWNRVVFEGHPRVSRTHVVDHWRLSRSDAPLAARWLTTRRMRSRATRELRAAGYDAAIDLASHYPNSAALLHDANIAVRVGYTSGGKGPLFTHAVEWSANGHVSDEHRALLDCLARAAAAPATGYELPVIPEVARRRAVERLERAGLAAGGFVVAHMGPGHERKEWPPDRWIAAGRELAARGERIVLTGAGPRQKELAARFAASVSGAVSLVDELSWDEFRATLAAARLVLSVDTVAMHVAAAHGTPCVALMTGMDRTERWRPMGENVAVLTELVPCAPCYRSRGCEAMTCIRDISTERVVEAAAKYLASS